MHGEEEHRNVSRNCKALTQYREPEGEADIFHAGDFRTRLLASGRATLEGQGVDFFEGLADFQKGTSIEHFQFRE